MSFLFEGQKLKDDKPVEESLQEKEGASKRVILKRMTHAQQTELLKPTQRAPVPDQLQVEAFSMELVQWSRSIAHLDFKGLQRIAGSPKLPREAANAIQDSATRTRANRLLDAIAECLRGLVEHGIVPMGQQLAAEEERRNTVQDIANKKDSIMSSWKNSRTFLGKGVNKLRMRALNRKSEKMGLGKLGSDEFYGNLAQATHQREESRGSYTKGIQQATAGITGPVAEAWKELARYVGSFPATKKSAPEGDELPMLLSNLVGALEDPALK